MKKDKFDILPKSLYRYKDAPFEEQVRVTFMYRYLLIITSFILPLITYVTYLESTVFSSYFDSVVLLLTVLTIAVHVFMIVAIRYGNFKLYSHINIILSLILINAVVYLPDAEPYSRFTTTAYLIAATGMFTFFITEIRFIIFYSILNYISITALAIYATYDTDIPLSHSLDYFFDFSFAQIIIAFVTVMNVKINNFLLDKTKEELEKRKESEKNIAQVENYRKTLWDKTSVPMLIFDPSINRYIDGNNAAVNYLGLESKEQLINMKPLDYIPEFQDNGERSDLAFSRFAKEVGVEKSLYFEWRILNAKQKTLYADVDLIRFIFDDKEYLRLSLIDITEIKLSHEKLKELNETLEKRVFDRTLELNQAFQQIENANFELKELNEDMAEESIKLVELNDKLVKSELELKQNNKIREKMFDAITHGIRNPLQAISLNIDIIKHHSDKLDKTELLNIFDNITVSFSNLNYQFEDILNFSRIKTGQHPIHSTEIKLKDFINVEIETYRPSISAKKMEVNNSIGEGFLIFTNHNVLNIVFIDLISSMLKSIQYNKKINIFDSSTFQNKCLSIQSTDTFFSDETIMECNNYLLNLDINVFRNINAFNFPKIIEYLDSINSRIEIENNQIGSLIKLFFPEKIEK